MASPLPITGPWPGRRSSCWRTSAPAARGNLGGAVGGPGVHHQNLVHEPAEPEYPPDDGAHRVGHLACGQHDGERRPLALDQLLEREVGVVEGARHAARTMANRWPRPAQRCPGRRCWSAARASSWWRARRERAPGRAHRARARAAASRPAATALARRGCGALYAHQADALASALRGPHDRDHRHRQRQVAGIQPAGAGHAVPRPLRARALPLPDQGAGPGPGAGAARAGAAPRCDPRSTTATRRSEERARHPRSAPT